MKKILIILLSSWVCFQQVQAQEFQKRFDLGAQSCLFSSIEITDSAFYVSGIARSSNPPNRLGVCFNKFDTLGNLLDTYWFIDSNAELGTWRPDLTETDHGTFSQCGYIIDSTGVHGFGIRYDADGDTIWTKRYYNPYDSTGFMRSDYYIALPENNHIIISAIENPNDIGSDDLLVVSYDSTHAQNWELIIDEPNYHYLSIDYAELLSDSTVLIGAMTQTLDPTQQFNQASFRLINIDLDGNILSHYKSSDDIDSMYQGVKDLYFTDDGDKIIVTESSKVVFNAAGNPQQRLNNAVLKLDSVNNIIWETILLGDQFGEAWDYGMRQIIPLDNQEFYVLGFINRLEQNYLYLSGYIAKMNEDGDSLGSREFNMITHQFSSHKINDAELLPNGQIVFCGESLATIPGEASGQQGWLCRVTMPEFVGITEEEITRGVPSLNLYPNPVSSLLSVELRTEKPIDNAHLRIVSMNGQVIQDHLIRGQHGSLFMMDVDHLASGVYVLQLVLDSGEMVGEPFVVQR